MLINNTKKYNHVEAFCLMLYKCKKCLTIEILWNSRDGVTPFCITCRQCHVNGEFPTMLHEYWQLDTRKKDYKPFIGQRIFVNGEIEKEINPITKEEIEIQNPKIIIFKGEI